MNNSALEPFNCTVFGDFKWVRKYLTPLVISKFIYFIPRVFLVGMSVVLFSRLCMSCAPFKGPANECCLSSIVFGLSVRQSVVTLTQSFLIEFLPNFIRGLLPPTSGSSSNTGFVRNSITKMTVKMAVLSVSAVVVTLTQPFLIKFLPNFTYELLSSPFRSSLNVYFVRRTITIMADKMAAAYKYLRSWLL